MSEILAFPTGNRISSLVVICYIRNEWGLRILKLLAMNWLQDFAESIVLDFTKGRTLEN